MTTPSEWGAWHIISILLTALACVGFGFLMRRASNKALRVFLAVWGVVLILLEIMRELVFGLSVAGEVATWDYSWFLFPFQFCSMVLYTSLIAGIIRPSRLQKYLLSFLSTFCMLAGFIVMLVPSQVLCHFTFINVQTMVHHGGMLVIATVVLSSGHARLDFKNVLQGFAVFAVCAVTALALNVAAVKIFNIRETFNMFYISPYFDCPMPVFSAIYKAVPYPVFLLLYLVGFVGGTCLVVYLVKLFKLLVKMIRVRWNRIEAV